MGRFLAGEVINTSTYTHEQSRTVFFSLHTQISVNRRMIGHVTMQAKVLETPV